MFGFNPNKITSKAERVKELDPQEFLALAKQEMISVEIKPEDLSSEGKLLAFPNGPESNLSEEYWRLVRTPAFKKWFGDSDIVDENGEPALVFHGTNENIDNFTNFDNEVAAKKRIEKAGVLGQAYETDGGFYFTAGNRSYGRNRITAFLCAKTKEVKKQSEIIWQKKGSVDRLKKQGHDGLVYYFDSAYQEVEDNKQKFRETYAPRKLADRIFFGAKKILQLPTTIQELVDSSKAGEVKRNATEQLRNIRDTYKKIRGAEQGSKTRFYEVCVFDSNQIMIVSKEEGGDEPMSGGS
jgi:hypothetical protein